MDKLSKNPLKLADFLLSVLLPLDKTADMCYTY